MTTVAAEPLSQSSDFDIALEGSKSEIAQREIRYEHSLNFAPLLTHLGASVLVSTYQAGKLAAVGVRQGALSLSFYNFERAMGMAVQPGRIAVGADRQIWFLRSAPDLAPKIEPIGQHDACYLTRSSHFTGDIQAHDMVWIGDELWVVNTLFSCLCTLDEHNSFVPRWRPPFIKSLAAEDRCHLNGLAVVDGDPTYVTAMAESDTPQGWRPTKATSGCLIDVQSGGTIAGGFAMPHSPRVHQDQVWLLDSGKGRLVVVDRASGNVETVAELPGYTRGLAILGSYAFIGLSKIRETSTFGGVPIAEQRDKLKCGVAVVDLATGRNVAFLEFHSGVEEIFDVQVLPGSRFPVLSGPFPHLDDTQPIWTVPEPRDVVPGIPLP